MNKDRLKYYHNQFITGLSALAILFSLTALQGSSAFSPLGQQVAVQTELLGSVHSTDLKLTSYKPDYSFGDPRPSLVLGQIASPKDLGRRHTQLSKLRIAASPDLTPILILHPKIIPSSREDDLFHFFLG